MTAPRLAGNLNLRRRAIAVAWPGVSVGWIGDAAHMAEHSDHNPDARGLVHAIDVMVVADRARTVLGQLLRHNDDLEYVIHDTTIWTRSTGWQPRHYTGAPHTDHIHASGKHGPTGRNTFTGVGYDMTAELLIPVFQLPGTDQPTPQPPPTPSPRPAPPGAQRILQLRRPPMVGADVRFVQRFIGPRQCGPADGVYGPHTAQGVRWYQRMRGITPDGVVGAITLAQMGIR